jgi:hypothetical protein
VHAKLNVDINIESEYGLVPEYEEREAAVFLKISWLDWNNQDYDEKAAALAHYRLHHHIEAHVHAEEAKESEKASKRAHAPKLNKPRGRR